MLDVIALIALALLIGANALINFRTARSWREAAQARAVADAMLNDTIGRADGLLASVKAVRADAERFMEVSQQAMTQLVDQRQAEAMEEADRLVRGGLERLQGVRSRITELLADALEDAPHGDADAIIAILDEALPKVAV